MIRAGFLSTEDRSDLIVLARDRSATHRLARRANALVLLDAGWNCQEVAGALLLDDDTIRIALLHRLGLEYHKPDLIPNKLNEEKQENFIAEYDNLLNSLADNEAVLFADAVHPTHAVRAAGCWAPKQEKLAIEQTSGRQRINIHGAINLETGQTRMIEVLTVDAGSTIRLLESIETFYPLLVLIHVFLDNARYHHAKLVQEWLARPGCRIKLNFVPSYCPHLNPIERLWGLMHRNITHNTCYATCRQF